MTFRPRVPFNAVAFDGDDWDDLADVLREAAAWLDVNDVDAPMISFQWDHDYDPESQSPTLTIMWQDAHPRIIASADDNPFAPSP